MQIQSIKKPPVSRATRGPLRVLSEVGWLFAAVIAIPAVILLLVSTVTMSGVLISAAIVVSLIGWALLLFRRASGILTRFTGYACLIAGAFLFLATWMRAPRLRIEPSASTGLAPGVYSKYNGTARFRSWTPSSLVPEIDQQLMGSRLFTFLDPLIDAQGARRIRELNRRVYDEMNRDDGFRQLPCSLGICYTEMFTGRTPTGHRFVYLPDATARSRERPLPVILFLHGSLGNFQGYLWVWKRFADANGFAIVAPSHGVGEWRDDRGLEEIRTALEFCQNEPGFDGSRIYLAGVSNGGAGITHAIPHLPGAFAGIVYLSPVIDPAKIAAPGFVDALRGARILVITGAIDNRVPTNYITSGVETLKQEGAEVTFHVIPDEDHFLIYSQPDEVMERVGEWVSRASR